MKVEQRLAGWLAGRVGMELHYPPAPEPQTERAGTKVDDGTPCSGWPVDPERYEQRKAAARDQPRGEYRP